MGINTTCCKKDSSNNESDFKVSNDMSSVINEKIEDFDYEEDLEEKNYVSRNGKHYNPRRYDYENSRNDTCMSGIDKI